VEFVAIGKDRGGKEYRTEEQLSLEPGSHPAQLFHEQNGRLLFSDNLSRNQFSFSQNALVIFPGFTI